MPVPGGKFRNGEPIDGTDSSDGNRGSIRTTRFSSVVLPDEMKDDRVIRGVEMVPVIDPAAGAQVDLDATGAQLASVKENERVAKIRSETVAPGTPVNDLQRNALGRGKAGGHGSRMPGGTEGNLGNPGAVLHFVPQRTAPREQPWADEEPFRRSLDLERFHFDRGQTCLAPFAVPSVLLDCGLQRTQRQGRAANAALDDILAHFVVDLGETELLHLVKGETSSQLSHD